MRISVTLSMREWMRVMTYHAAGEAQYGAAMSAGTYRHPTRARTRTHTQGSQVCRCTRIQNFTDSSAHNRAHPDGWRGSGSEGTQADKQTERSQISKQREFAWRELDVAPCDLPGFFAMVEHQPEKDDIHLVHLGANQKGVLRNLVTAEFHFLR